jgi:N-acyl-D-aspartate/D-glutamate deacylase
MEIVSSGVCHYARGLRPEAGHGIDRKNSSLGYVMGNCSACCATCNHIRGKDFISRSEMIEVAKLLCALRIPLTFVAVAAQGNPERNSCIVALYPRFISAM